MPDARPAILAASQALAEDVGASLDRGGSSSVTSAVRRFLRRALWPLLQDQRRVDSSVLDAVTSLQRSIHQLDERVRRLERDAARNESGGRDTIGRAPGVGAPPD